MRVIIVTLELMFRLQVIVVFSCITWLSSLYFYLIIAPTLPLFISAVTWRCSPFD